MINEKMFEGAANDELKSVHSDYQDKDGYILYPSETRDIDSMVRSIFIDGAKWMQEEFVNNLWHDPSEEPKKGVTFLVSMRNHGDHKISYYLDDSGDVLETFISWSAYASYFGVTHWCYLSDFLPTCGGEK